MFTVRAIFIGKNPRRFVTVGKEYEIALCGNSAFFGLDDGTSAGSQFVSVEDFLQNWKVVDVAEVVFVEKKLEYFTLAFKVLSPEEQAVWFDEAKGRKE